MDDWMTHLPGLWARAWDRLDDGASDPSAAARRVALATVGVGGGAEVRMVALREVNRAEAWVAIFTDSETEKIQELAAEPRASLLAWIPEDEMQLRLRLEITVETGPALDPLWAELPDHQRLNYGGAPLPGRPMPSAETYGKTIQRDRFARLLCRVTEMDVVHLGAPLHRRAVFRAADAFAGGWIAP